MVALLSRIEAEIEAAGELTLAGIGDPAELWRNEAALARSPVAPYVVDLMCREWGHLPSGDAARFVFNVVRETTHPLALSDSLDAVLARPPVLEALGNDLGALLLERAGVPFTDGGEIATRALEGALRLVLGGWSARRLDLLVTLSRFEGETNLYAVARLCRLIGVSDEQWPTDELVSRLDEEVGTGDPTGDASFELGLAKLRRALGRGDIDNVLDGLAEARTHLRAARDVIEERTDAMVYELAIDAIIGYTRHRDSTSLSELAVRLREILIGRNLWRPVAKHSWLQPRAEAELEWQRLSEMLAHAARAFEEQWLAPPTMLAQLAETYSASRSVRLFAWKREVGDAVDLLIEPRLEHDFLEEEFRVEILAQWLRSEELIEDDREAAERLLESLRAGGRKKARRPFRFPQSS